MLDQCPERSGYNVSRLQPEIMLFDAANLSPAAASPPTPIGSGGLPLVETSADVVSNAFGAPVA